MKLKLELPVDHWALRIRLLEMFLGLSLIVFGLYVTFVIKGQIQMPFDALYPRDTKSYIDTVAVGPLFVINGILGLVALFVRVRQNIVSWFSDFMYSGAYSTVALWTLMVENGKMFPFVCMLVVMAMYCLVIRSCRIISEVLR